MRFQVPQFIEVTDKIIGPLTLKQFLYLAGGGAAIFLLYISMPFFLFVIFAAPVAAFAAALAFYKIHGKPFITVTENALRHFMKRKIYTWKKREGKTPEIKKAPKSAPLKTPVLTKRRLDNLSWSLDINKNLSKRE